MVLTKELLNELDETDLRTKVLIPLFQAMGFRDVFHYHGGVLEHGKDIVMWKSDDLEQRITEHRIINGYIGYGHASTT